ncbi:hypothetical protein IFR05_015150 [Cadophora sp. M221]|nr:hypothetical protein IFR05_015150 [Cadophora sp. M221]
MPELSEITYSHDTTVRAFRDYFRFLVEMYMDEAEILEPPVGRWPSISSDFQRCFGKTDEVISLLRDIPYIREDGHYHPAHGSAICQMADWQSLGRVAEEGELSVQELRIMSEGAITDDVPS